MLRALQALRALRAPEVSPAYQQPEGLVVRLARLAQTLPAVPAQLELRVPKGARLLLVRALQALQARLEAWAQPELRHSAEPELRVQWTLAVRQA